jgi:hypothetical protein
MHACVSFDGYDSMQYIAYSRYVNVPDRNETHDDSPCLSEVGLAHWATIKSQFLQPKHLSLLRLHLICSKRGLVIIEMDSSSTALWFRHDNPAPYTVMVELCGIGP